jgi:Winged helix DNA-binding domain
VVTPGALSLRSLGRATLARQLLLERSDLPVPEAVARVGGLQAQAPKPPYVALWTRLRDFHDEDLTTALRERTVVRATLMRGTLHTVAAQDYASARTAVAPLLAQAVRANAPGAESVTSEVLVSVARELLLDRPLTFAQLRPLLAERFPGVSDRSLGFAVRMSLPLVLIPTDARWGFPAVAQFGLADAWLGPAGEPVPERQAREDVALRHLAAFGPATAADVQFWSGMRGIREVLEGLADRLVEFSDDKGRRLYDLPDAPRPGPDIPAPPRYLPEWESLLIAHADHRRVIDDDRRAVLMTSNGRLGGSVLWDGRVVAGYDVARKGSTALLTVTPFEKLTRTAINALSEEGERLLRFLEPDATTRDVRVAAR